MYLNLKIHSPVGVFMGYINSNTDEPEDVLCKLRDELEARMHDMTYVVLNQSGGADVYVPQQVLTTSVIEFAVSEKPL